MKLSRLAIAAAGLAMVTSAAQAQVSDADIEAINARVEANQGFSAATRSEYVRCSAYWNLWAEQHAELMNADELAKLHPAIQPDAAVKAVEWHTVKTDEAYAGADAYRMEERVEYMEEFGAAAQTALDNWKADKSDIGFFSWLGNCGVRG